MKPTTRIAVLGGGLQGACVAMELASNEFRVDLYEKHDRVMSQASARNEGKIHLGYLYANDPSLRTARTMATGAIAFAPLMRRWIGSAFDRIPVSTPFYYVVHRESLLTIDEFDRHLRCSHAVLLEESRDTPLDYFNANYRVPPTRMLEREWHAILDPRRVAAAYRTEEMSIDSEALATLVRDRLNADQHIRCLTDARVQGVAADESGATVDVEISGSLTRERYDHVVNALWDGRLAVDRTVGLDYSRSWLYRVKHALRLRAPRVAPSLPSTTIVLGAFGDLVAYDDGSLYLSWYPAGLRGTSSEISPPAWPMALDEESALDLRQRILHGLREVIPSVAQLTDETIEDCRIEGGVIFAWGETDITDPASGLHQRFAIGPRSHGRYHTIDTGKLTMAPAFGQAVAENIRCVS